MMTTVEPIDELLQQKRLECQERLNQTHETFEPGKFCRGTWEGWLCWPDTQAGTSAQAPCPEFKTGFDPSRFAHKDCDADGSWFRHPETNKTWSNYTTCINFDDFEWRQQINFVYVCGYSVSLIAILLSLAVLGYFRSLKCARITIHMNLFASFAANNSLWLLWYRAVVPDPDVLEQNKPGCIILHLVLHYFMLCNYAWMLCEGFYLHTVLVSAFISEHRLVRWLMAFGWIAPVIIILSYGIFRGLHGTPLDNRHCWMEETMHYNVLRAPVVISLMLNLLFLCNIVRVLFMKLRAPAGPQGGAPSRNILQAFRATLLLVPLLGMQYILTPFRPEEGADGAFAYELISAVIISFQGLCVATLFCFFNGEVIAQVKRKYRTLFFSSRARSNSYTATQVSFVRNGPPIPGEEKV